MESLDLLAREEEFRKLNKQLNKKTESLMKEIEIAMQKPDVFSDFSHSLIFNPNNRIKKHNYNSPSNTSSSTNTLDSNRCKNRKDCKKYKRIQFETNFNDSESTKTVFDSNNDVKGSNDSIKRDNNIKNKNDTYLQDIERHIDDDVKFDGIKSDDKNRDDIVNNGINNDEAAEVDDNKNIGDDNKTDNKVISQDNDDLNKNYQCICCNDVLKKDDSLEFLYAFVSINVKEDVLPKSFLRGNISVESVCKCLSSRIKLLQEEIAKLQSVIKKQKTQCESHMRQLADLESERMTLLNKSNNMTTSVMEMRAKFTSLQKHLEVKDRLYKEQRSEGDRMSSEIKRLKSRNASIEAKFASHSETVETLKQQLEVSRRSEKEFKDSSRVLSASHESAISKLESQIKALTSKCEKQMALINNLRKQNLILKTEGAMNALEKDYNQFLKQDFE